MLSHVGLDKAANYEMQIHIDWLPICSSPVKWFGQRNGIKDTPAASSVLHRLDFNKYSIKVVCSRGNNFAGEPQMSGDRNLFEKRRVHVLSVCRVSRYFRTPLDSVLELGVDFIRYT